MSANDQSPEPVDMNARLRNPHRTKPEELAARLFGTPEPEPELEPADDSATTGGDAA